jgi:cell wall-associated NlpC family hydrolase
VASGGISGVAVALATAGGVLLYAGFQGLNPLEALKDITSGKTRQLVAKPTSFVNDATAIGQGGGGVTQAMFGSAAGGGHPEIVAAAMAHRGEKYSQARRWDNGYSDCSSFVGKALKDVGITPPSGSVTGSYLVWRELRTVPKGAILPGDILAGSGHVAIAVSPTTAIGQQNGRQNVRVDSIDSIMFGQTWVPRRYVGAASGSAAGSSAGVAAA